MSQISHKENTHGRANNGLNMRSGFNNRKLNGFEETGFSKGHGYHKPKFPQGDNKNYDNPNYKRINGPKNYDDMSSSTHQKIISSHFSQNGSFKPPFNSHSNNFYDRKNNYGRINYNNFNSAIDENFEEDNFYLSINQDSNYVRKTYSKNRNYKTSSGHSQTDKNFIKETNIMKDNDQPHKKNKTGLTKSDTNQIPKEVINHKKDSGQGEFSNKYHNKSNSSSNFHYGFNFPGMFYPPQNYLTRGNSVGIPNYYPYPYPNYTHNNFYTGQVRSSKVERGAKEIISKEFNSDNYLMSSKKSNKEDKRFLFSVIVKLKEEEKLIHVHKNDDYMKLASKFCLFNHLDNSLIIPIYDKITFTAKYLDEVMSKELNILDYSKLLSIKDEVDFREKVINDPEVKLNISCIDNFGGLEEDTLEFHNLSF